MAYEELMKENERQNLKLIERGRKLDDLFSEKIHPTVSFTCRAVIEANKRDDRLRRSYFEKLLSQKRK